MVPVFSKVRVFTFYLWCIALLSTGNTQGYLFEQLTWTKFPDIKDKVLSHIVAEVSLKKKRTYMWLLYTSEQNYKQYNTGSRPPWTKYLQTPNPKCRLYRCLIEFIDWRYSQSYWYFRPLLWTSAPLTLSLVHYPPPPSMCVNTCRKVPLLVNF
jgi:hypothetical protein